ncbi:MULTISPECIES: phage major capsid protein [Bacteroides]|uniref:phage major capsid protein n=1 Tax=Bacteroides TaxID=816 RepID=UPI00259C8217|nr:MULTISPECIES: phage major capsid protein [Bacteroides]
MKPEVRRNRVRIAEINTRLSEMADSVETEKRSLSQDEITERDALVQEREILKLRSARLTSDDDKVNDQEATYERAFTEAVFSIVKKRSLPEGCEGFVSGEEIAIPLNRSVQNTASAAPLIPLTIGDIIQPLEKGLILSKVGCKMQYGLTGDFVLPVVAGIEATIEDENAEVADTTIDISKLKPSPKRVSLAIPVSNRAIDQSNSALLEIVRTQITMGLTRLLNRWMFNLAKITSKASEGCFVKNAPTLVCGSEFKFKDAVALKGRVMATGVVFDGTAAYVCSATTYTDLEATPRDAGSGRMVIENGLINGFPVFMTEYVGDGVLGFGIFNYELVGQFGKMHIIVDPYTGAKKNLVYFVMNTDFDMLTVRPEAFGIAKITTIPSVGVDNAAPSLSTTSGVATTKDLFISGANLTAGISLALGGDNKSLFAINKQSIAKDDAGNVGTKVTVTYTPTASGQHTATLTLSSAGATNVVVSLSGSCS